MKAKLNKTHIRENFKNCVLLFFIQLKLPHGSCGGAVDHVILCEFVEFWPSGAKMASRSPSRSLIGHPQASVSTDVQQMCQLLSGNNKTEEQKRETKAKPTFRFVGSQWFITQLSKMVSKTNMLAWTDAH